MDYEINIVERIQELGYDIEDVTPEQEMYMRMQLGQLVDKAKIEGNRLAKERLKSKATDYIKALKKSAFGSDGYIIELNEDMVPYDEGFCVLYCPNNKRYQPKVYTPNGYRAVSEIKPGDFVLNQYGKFTEVLKVHDRDYLEDCRLLEKDIIKKTKTGSKGQIKATFKCPRCETTTTKTLNRSGTNKNRVLCDNCLSKKEYVDIHMYSNQNLRLTPEHQVLTKYGWKMAKDLDDRDEISIEAFNECVFCGRPSHTKFCSGACRGAMANDKMLKSGRHASQQERARDVYLNNLNSARKNSKLEAAFARYFSEYNSDFIRQHRVRIKKETGIYSVYKLDFFFPNQNVGVEMDGVKFHCGPRDAIRDKYIKDQHGIDIIRITSSEWKNDYKGCIQMVLKRLANHDGHYDFVYKRPFRIIKKTISNGFSTTRRWDITVKEGSSFLCQGIIIHNSPFDMKPGLLHGPNAKISKAGVMYNIVPIKGSPEYGSAGKTEFKVVTGNSPKNSWIHPGFSGAQIFDEMAYYMEWMIDRLIEETLGG